MVVHDSVVGLVGGAAWVIHSSLWPGGVNHVVLINYSGLKIEGPILVKSETDGDEVRSATSTESHVQSGLRAEAGFCCVVNFDHAFYGDASFAVADRDGTVVFKGTSPRERYRMGRYGHVLVIAIGNDKRPHFAEFNGVSVP